MLTIARRFLSEVRSGFWFLPSLLLAAHVGLAMLLTSTDLGESKPWMAQWPHLFGAGADGSRGMLSTIAASMMTVVGVTLSMTLITLALASSQYTSRILRNFIRDRTTQFVLGLFAGTYCYCLIVLRTIRGGDEGGFVPGLAVLLAAILAVSGISVLIYFIHHIATSIQASNIIASVAAETTSALERMYPEVAVATVPDDAPRLRQPQFRWKPITAVKDGYVERIDFDRLEELARLRGTTLRIERAIGDFVIKGMPLVSMPQEAIESEELTRALAGSIDIGRHRTVEQDLGFGIRQLVDIALRAQSPGVNDTTTAIMCVDYLTGILARLGTRSIPETPGSAEGYQRLVNARPQSFAGLVGEAFDEIRESARGKFAILARLLDAIETIGALPIGATRLETLLHHVDLLDETARSSVENPRERERLTAMAQHLRSSLSLH